MEKIRQYTGMALMMVAMAVYILGYCHWGICLGLFFVAWMVTTHRLSALVHSWSFFSLIVYLVAPFIWILSPDTFFSPRFEILAVACIFGSAGLLGIYYVFVPVMWPKIAAHFYHEGDLTLDDLAPEKGQTVQQIRLNPKKFNIRFLFGKADEALVKEWELIAEEVARTGKKRRRIALRCVFIAIIWPFLIFFGSGGMDASLQRDIVRMWDTEPSSVRPGLVVSTPSAMHAAKRVFRNERHLRGMTKAQAREYLKFHLKNPKFKLGKPRYDFEDDETLLVFSDGRDSVRLVVLCNDEGQIVRYWPEEYMTLMVRDLEKSNEPSTSAAGK